MQRTVFDNAYTPGAADKIGPALASQYPSKTHDLVRVPFRTAEGLRRVRIVIQLRKVKPR